MPRYFFHLHTESLVAQDVVGVDFCGLEDAVADARQARAEFLRDEGIEGGRQQRRCRFEITDECRRLIATVPVADN
ncbi:MAG: hypothetical protein WAM53_03460 [Terrimicrobiaceae bacterium]|jgi:hypothetical protein